MAILNEAADHDGAAVVLLLSMQGLPGALSGRADNITNYMEGFTYLILIVVALILVGLALKDFISGSKRQSGEAMSVGTIIVTGLYPCPGAILVMLLSLSLKITGIGIFAVLAMSLSMSIPIIAAGVALFGYALLLAFSIYMAEPFIASFVRMIR